MHDETPEAARARTEADTTDRPTMLGSSARAATAEEARYRIDYPNSLTRASRIFALDARAAEAMYGVTEEPWNGARFLTVGAVHADTGAMDPDALPLSGPDGGKARLSDELEGADVVVMLASADSDAGPAEVIARAARERHIMLAGLALGDGLSDAATDRIVAAMRPFATVLVVAAENDFIPAMLEALRA